MRALLPLSIFPTKESWDGGVSIWWGLVVGFGPLVVVFDAHVLVNPPLVVGLRPPYQKRRLHVCRRLFVCLKLPLALCAIAALRRDPYNRARPGLAVAILEIPH